MPPDLRADSQPVINNRQVRPAQLAFSFGIKILSVFSSYLELQWKPPSLLVSFLGVSIKAVEFSKAWRTLRCCPTLPRLPCSLHFQPGRSGVAHLGLGASSPSRCSSCSGPRRSASRGRAGAGCARRTGARCSCGSAQWPRGRNPPRGCGREPAGGCEPREPWATPIPALLDPVWEGGTVPRALPPPANLGLKQGVQLRRTYPRY